MDIGKEWKEKIENRFKDKELLLLSYRGSMLHGTAIMDWEFSSDDIDLIGVYREKDISKYPLQMTVRKGKEISEGEKDIVIYDCLYFFNLLLNANPNVLAPIFAPDEFVVYCDPRIAFWREAENRNQLITLKFYHTMKGYAHSMIQKFEKSKDKGGSYFGYMGEKRKQLVDKIGYDSKYIAHAFRLLSMGTEILEKGSIYLDRRNRDSNFLMNVKRGDFTIEEIKELMEEKLKKFERAKEKTELIDMDLEKTIELRKRFVLPLIGGSFL